MPLLLLTIAAGDHDANASAVSGVQTNLTGHNADQSFLFLGAGALKGATINSAVLRVRSSGSGGINPFPPPQPFTKFSCEDADSPLPFVNGEPFANFTGRPRTAFVTWDLGGTLSFILGGRVDSPSFAPAVQAIVSRPGWNDGLHVFWERNPGSILATFSYNYHPTTAAELLIDYTPAASDSALVSAAEAIVQTLTADSFSQAFTPVRSYAQWQRPFEVAEAVGLQVDVIAFPQMDDDLNDRGSVKYEPAIDIVIRKKFAGADLEEVPGGNEARVKSELVDALVALLEEINESLVARRLGAGGEVAWKDSRILATYVPAHLREKHQYTGVIRIPTEVVKALPES